MYGAEAVILNLSRTINRGPHRSLLGVFSNSTQPNLQMHETASAQGIESFLVACTGQVDRTVPSALRSLTQKTGADVVHAHGYKADVYAYLAFRQSATPLVSTCHTWYDNDALVRLYGALDRRILREYAGVIAVSDDVKQRLLNSGVHPDRIRLIRNGIDTQPFRKLSKPPQDRPPESPDPARPLTVGLVGRLANEKGVDLFLRSAAEVLKLLPSTRFVVVGDGPDRAALEALIDQLHIRSGVTLLGRSEDMPSTYASLDLMVSSSRQEGLPIAILEGMASGLPLVATSVGAVPSVVQDRATGVLVPPEDVPALTAAIVSLLRDPAARSRLSAAARQRIETEFSAERMTSEYLQLYSDVLAKS